MPMSEKAKAAAKEKRAKLKDIRKRREAAQAGVAQALLEDNDEKVGNWKAVLQGLEIEEKELTMRKDAWVEHPDGRWVREIVIDQYRIGAKLDPLPDYWQATIILATGENVMWTSTGVALNLEQIRTQANAVIGAYRAIARGLLPTTEES